MTVFPCLCTDSLLPLRQSAEILDTDLLDLLHQILKCHQNSRNFVMHAGSTLLLTETSETDQYPLANCQRDNPGQR
jgi:hypothetical protein